MAAVDQAKRKQPRSAGQPLDLPVTSFIDWNTVGLVQSALIEHDQGIFRSSALLADAFESDDRIAGVMETRLNALFSLPIDYGDKPKAQAKNPNAPKVKGAKKPDPKLARIAEIAQDLRGDWDEMFPLDQLMELDRWGVELNAGVGQLLWSTNSKGQWRPKLKVWHPQYLYWRWDTRSFWIATQGEVPVGPDSRIDQGFTGGGQIEVTPGDGTWVLYTPRGFQRGWIHAAVRSLAIPWIVRRWAYRDWARYSEIHGLPIKKAIVPTNADQKVKDRFLAEIAALGVESAVRTERESKDVGFDLELVEAEANTWEGFDRLITQVNDSIAVRLLGQNLTTETRSGSLAAAKVQEKVRTDYLQFDATSLSKTLRDQVLKPWAEFNYGDEELAPSPKWITDPEEDKKAKADAITSLGTGITSLRSAGANVDVVKVCEQFDVPLVEGEPLKEPDPPPMPPGFGGQGPQGGPPRPGQPPAPAKKAQLRTVPPADQRGQLFVDQLGDDAHGKGVGALHIDLRAVLAVVEEAKSYEGLRAGLVKAFGKMKPKRLAELMQRALILAELNGRQTVLEEL